MEQPKPQNPNQRYPSIDEQVSLVLAHFNRANNQVAKEAELAVVKMVSQLQTQATQYTELMKKYQELKDKYEQTPKKEDKIPPKTPENSTKK